MWEKDDRDKAMWWTVRQKQTCPQCGTRAAEWDETQGGSRHAYVAKVGRCPGCEAVGDKQEKLQDPSKIGRGVHIKLVKPGG